MAVQPPFRSDAFSVENADAPAGDRLIEADTLDGSLRFTDTRVPSGIDLHQLGGLQRGHNVIVVSQSGEAASKDAAGDPITTIQGGLDAVPMSADKDDPWIVVAMPGLYIEDVYFLKDGVTLVGLGSVVLRNATAVSTVRVRAGVMNVPRKAQIQNIRIECTQALEACVDLSSATFASGTLTIASVPNIGDIAEINGVNLMAVANGTVPAPGEFELGADETETAANLVTAIADPANALVGTVVATSAANIVQIRASQDGVAGNAITISSTVPLVIVASGATLTGGAASAAGSTVGSEQFACVACDLVPTDPSGFHFRANSVNNLRVVGGDWREAAFGSSISVADCAYFMLQDQANSGSVTLTYDSASATLPFVASSEYVLFNVDGSMSNLGASFVTGGAGSIKLTDCTFLGNVTYNADNALRTFDATRCRLGACNVAGIAPAMTLSNCSRGALVGAGTGTLAETTFQGVAAFAAQASVTVTFDEPQPDTNYSVLLEYDGPPAAITDVPSVPVAAKLAASFDVTFGAAQTTNVNFVVKRDI